MGKHTAEIEPIGWSVIAHDTRFTLNYLSANQVHKIRMAHMDCTEMLWVPKCPVIDSVHTVYNPVALIMLFLN